MIESDSSTEIYRIGIDPGISTFAFVLYDKVTSKIVQHESGMIYSCLKGLEYLIEKHKLNTENTEIFIEWPLVRKVNFHVYQGRKIRSHDNYQSAINQNIGQASGAAKQTYEMLKSLGFKNIKKVDPSSRRRFDKIPYQKLTMTGLRDVMLAIKKTKGTKVPADVFNELFGYNKTTNQDVRDAATLVI